MRTRIHSITFDCGDAAALARFWAEVLGRPVDEGASEFFARLPAAEDEPMLMFIQVPEGKAAKNRLHLDIDSNDLAADIDRLVGLGAVLDYERDQWGVHWATLTDPEGNEFCIAEH